MGTHGAPLGGVVSPRRCSSDLRPHAREVGDTLRYRVEFLGLAVLVEDAATGGIKIEQDLAPGRIADLALGPAEGRQAGAAGEPPERPALTVSEVYGRASAFEFAASGY